jgi:hypothetical protein
LRWLGRPGSWELGDGDGLRWGAGWRWAFGMVIKDNKLRQKLWNLHFVDGLRKKECVARFTGAKLA